MANFNLFNSIRVKKPKRNRFDLSHDVKTTAKFGVLTPILCQPVLPGDTFKLNTEILCRFAPFQAPVMHHCKIYTHFFFVPNRLIWDNWKEFITGGENGESSPEYPRIDLTNTLSDSQLHQLCSNGTLLDYLGFPSYDHDVHKAHENGHYGIIDALPFRAYQLIWNEYYRDENLQDPIDIGKENDGLITKSSEIKRLMDLRKRAWKKDYFTSALPFAQRGDEVELPLMGDADIIYNDVAAYTRGAPLSNVRVNGGAPGFEYSGPIISKNNRFEGENGESLALANLENVAVETELRSSELSKLIKGVDLSNVSAATINELRRAVKAQEFLEAMARGGSRYIEQIYSIFGVRSSDARLQRPEFLGGGKSNVVISDVLQTSQTTDGNPLATPAGHGVSVQNTHSFKRFFEEHGYVIGIMSIMPMPAYQQGMPRLFTKFDRLDYYWPQFAHLGEQEITQGEIFHTGDPNRDSKLFGYTPRYAEYKFIPDSVHGDFRGNLSFWHMGRIFDSPPALNADFLTNVQDAANRPFSVQDTDFDKIWINIHHNLKAMRPMPVYGTPRL